MIYSGTLRHVLVIQTKSTDVDDAGQQLDTWTDYATVRGSITDARGKEGLALDQNIAESSTKIFMRYISGLNPSMRVKWVDDATDRYFEIVSIAEDRTRRRSLTLHCREMQR